MMRLADLRSQLQTVARRRQTARRVIGGSALVLAVLWSIAVFFLLDWTFSMGRLERTFTLLVIAGVVGVTYWMLARPWFWRHEDEVDVALLVEKQRGIDSDLVAALEFEQPKAAKWGSGQLRDAVIDYVTDYGRQWNLLADFPRDQMKRRAIMVAVTVGVLLIVMALLPEHMLVLANRLMLGSMHYPTRTRIRQVTVGDAQFQLGRYGQHKIFVRRPFGEEVDVAVTATGIKPQQGALRLRSQIGGAKTTVALTTETKQESDKSGKKAEQTVYRAKLPRLVDTLSWSIELGDAWTEPATLEVVPLPVVELKLQATPPQYAKNRVSKDASGPTTRRQLSVFEGSRVDLQIACSNKRLKSAVVKLDKVELPMTKADADGHVWKLAADKTPLAEVTAPISFAINIRDEDGLGPERPLEGAIGVEADRPPQGEIQLVTRKCLPSAAPRIDYSASDDYGVAAVLLRAKIRRTGSEKIDEVVQPIWKTGQPKMVKGPGVAGQYQFDMKPLNLVPGDQVALMLEVQDYRGNRKSESAHSAPEVLAITDQAAVDGAISEIDARGEQLFGDIISRLIGTEEKK